MYFKLTPTGLLLHTRVIPVGCSGLRKIRRLEELSMLFNQCLIFTGERLVSMFRSLGLAVFGALTFALLTVIRADAATLNVVGGELLGASGVNVGGVLYDVEFVEGSCISLFAGCDEVTDLDFDSATTATAAAQALLDQVLIDGPQGNFGSDPSLTFGCSHSDLCLTFVPYDTILPNGRVNTKYAYNFTGGDSVGNNQNILTRDTASRPLENYARFSVSPVPLPAALPLFLTMLAGMAGLRWWRRRTTAV